MAQANDSITVTPGTGATVATHLVGGREHQVVMIAGADGHITGSRPDYFAWYPPATNAASRVVAELFNADATLVLRVRGIWIVPDSAAITGVPISFTVARGTAVGTGGTAVAPVALDTNNPALPAGVTAGVGRTAGGGTLTTLFNTYLFNEETVASTQLTQFQNLLPVLGEKTIDLVLRQNQGIRVTQLAAATVGATGALILLSTE